MNSLERHPTITGKPVTIRPIRITDAEMEAEFVQRLSPTTKHFRFLGGVNELSTKDIERFCDVDGRHSMAFVATFRDQREEREIGVSRYAPNSEMDVREMAVTVADDWQDQGLGTLLTERLIEHAKGYGIKQLYSIDFVDNLAMRNLAKDIGMTATPDPDDAHQVIYSLSLCDTQAEVDAE
jgi:GNAT superfamily N-acetyltransferase